MVTDVGAGADAAQDAYAQGVAAFRREQYAVAAAAFEKARLLGRNDSRIYYNLGSVYYRLGMFGRAEDNYLKAAEFPDAREISWYNLGLVALQQEDWAKAARWFTQVTGSMAPQKLRSLGAIALGRAQQKLANAAHIRLRVNGGHNTNVVGLSDTALSRYAGQGGNFFDVQAGYDSHRYEFSGNGARAATSLYTIRYPGKAAVNVSAASGAVMLDRPDANSRWDASLGAGKLWYGGDSYDNYRLVSLARALTWQGYEARIGYEWARIDSLTALDPGLSGIRRTLQFEGSHRRIDGTRFSAGYGHESNNREAVGDSPTRNEYRLGWGYAWSDQDSIVTQYTHRDSSYPLSGTLARRDKQNAGDAEFRHRIDGGGGAYLTLTLRRTANWSNDPGFSYSQNVIALGAGFEG